MRLKKRPKLPIVSGHDMVKALSKIGYIHKRTSGGHAILQKETEMGRITIPIPLHKELAKGTLKSIMRQANLNAENLIQLL